MSNEPKVLALARKVALSIGVLEEDLPIITPDDEEGRFLIAFYNDAVIAGLEEALQIPLSHEAGTAIRAKITQLRGNKT